MTKNTNSKQRCDIELKKMCFFKTRCGGFLRALRANPDKLKVMSDDFIVGGSVDFISHMYIRFNRRVNDSIAINAANVIMLIGISVEPFQGTAGFKLLYFPQFRKYFQVSINSSKTNARKTLLDHLIDFVGTWMCVYFSEFFQDDSSLMRHSKAMRFSQTDPVSYQN